ncbi:MAG: DUF2974 domain-containing protein [Clostridia bacterium]|nr:DUF2974 domain-containing protein [Clostridia bacterium]
MPNIRDHAMTVGHQKLERRPFDALDALVISQLVYLPMEGHLTYGRTSTIAQAWDFLRENVDPSGFDRFQKKRWALFETCAGLERYRDWGMCDYVNEIDVGREMQFSACTYRLPGGLSCVAYRGTDLTVVGWKEDLNMSYMTVPSQHEAAEYALRASRRTGDALILCGHSKGGNLSVYAAATTDSSTRERIRRVYAFDAPGVDEETLHSHGYALVNDRIESYLPQSSVVGMLLNYHPVYTVVEAATLGILQHDAMTWQVENGAFVTLAGVDVTGRLTDETIHAWLAGMDMEERRFLVDTLYQVVDAAQAELVTDLATDWLESAGKMLEAIRGLDSKTRRNVVRLLHSLFSTGAGEIVKLVLSELLKIRNSPANGE